ncbi:MAG: ABC transporter substrate-binding protein [Solirubrobacterales bacterium]|nr:ABC transporter substrate-binding protein [Solirubrobacterales bacterium]
MVVYSSQPLVGRMAPQGRDVVRGERLALLQAGGKVGSFNVVLRALNSAQPPPALATWEAPLVLANANLAAKDPRTVAYIGELDTGASAVSIPVLNGQEILQISPADTVAGLTSPIGATGNGEPQKYYPNGRRTFARLMPSDYVEAGALVAVMRQDSIGKLLITSDDTMFADSLATNVADMAVSAVIEVVGRQVIRAGRSQNDPVGISAGAEVIIAAADASGADGVLLSCTGSAVGLLINEIANRRPGLRLYAPSPLGADPAFVGQLDSAGAASTALTYAPLPAAQGPIAAEKFVADFRRAFGAQPQPYAVYGYQAMRAVLAAIRSAGKDANRRRAVTKAFFGAQHRGSPIGSYATLPNGNTTTREYGLYRPEMGGEIFEQRVVPFDSP